MFWIDASARRQAGEPERSVKELDARKLSIMGVFVFFSVGVRRMERGVYGEGKGYVW